MSGYDETLLEAVAELYAALDPAPDDLADGVLARLAVQDLETEFELFTLVQTVDTRAGTRQVRDPGEPETSASVALEFAGSTYRVLVRVSDTADGQRRLDGWVVPALPMRIFLGPQGDALAHTRQSAYADREGRFEFPSQMRGEVRLWLLPQGARGDGLDAPPFVTPPFLV
jgi:hypothetical protein